MKKTIPLKAQRDGWRLLTLVIRLFRAKQVCARCAAIIAADYYRSPR